MSRYAAFIASLLLAVVSLVLAMRWPGWWWGVAAFGALAVLGTVDMLQTRSTLRRNYPILAHFRYGLESIGPELRQYFFESDLAEVPFSRQQRTPDGSRNRARLASNVKHGSVPRVMHHDERAIASESSGRFRGNAGCAVIQLHSSLTRIGRDR